MRPLTPFEASGVNHREPSIIVRMNEGSRMRHVLVVDDSTVIRKIVRRVLEGMNLEITEAADVRQALAVCSLSMPDAIFVDGGMPTLDGCEFLRKLRRMHGGDSPKAIICLNENDVAQIARAMHAGASDFMMKPFDADHVRAKFGFLGASQDSATSPIPSRAYHR
jgi:two-component system, chemotaxis family, chemotaxis protein CheY